MTAVYVIHENSEWLAPLQTAFEQKDIPFEEWRLIEGSFSFDAAPPEGVFYNRMSASSHTRGHDFAPEYTASVLAWLEAHGRRVVNNSRALSLEVSKVRQYAALQACGVRIPKTTVAVGKEAVRKAAQDFGAPLILKPNRGGKGAGVQLFNDLAALDAFLDSEAYDPGPDGTLLLQDYIKSPEPFILRNEFVGGEHLYTVRVDTSQGFELCPADVCQIDDLACPVGSESTSSPQIAPRFEILKDFTHPNLELYKKFLRDNGIEVAGIEMIFDENGIAWTYDVNTNTNYNPEAEEAAGFSDNDKSGMGALSRFLNAELERQSISAAA
ncbi:MAG: alpha-L-glutamate ligase [Alphaproteobacteria bacterium]|nr:alpha-L-glutamate ligase [Alphaproteobacteria bacterium]